jgi:hypothetical protein
VTVTVLLRYVSETDALTPTVNACDIELDEHDDEATVTVYASGR